MKILNLYAGIGGNRKLWGDEHEIVTVEKDQETAEIYGDFFPQDKVVVADAHEYLIENFREFDFIWSSPPCPTHSSIRKARVRSEEEGWKYPDMSLYEEIIFLKNFFDGSFAVENVNPYYDALIKPQKVGRHRIWSNFTIGDLQVGTPDLEHASVSDLEEFYGFDLSDYDIPHKKKRKLLRNCVDPRIGKHILEKRTIKQQKLPRVASSR